MRRAADHIGRLRVFAATGAVMAPAGGALALGGEPRSGGGLAAAGAVLVLWETIGLWLAARKQVGEVEEP
ncbi:hypothetical protein AB0K09_09365 [Streptomyces sp. NPDC049577]|uniref:hypothetical protein n=1 Tax=Streptomyces sp. NPDC049577 TaxID=3155153 RepID=UPI003424D1EA